MAGQFTGRSSCHLVSSFTELEAVDSLIEQALRIKHFPMAHEVKARSGHS
jgi:hypothetical protein